MTENMDRGVMPAMARCDECNAKVVCDRIKSGLCPDCRDEDPHPEWPPKYGKYER